MGRPNVTSADVAAAAGVSRATVSYVLNGVDARVSDQTRERVLAAARELGYTPNAMASALRAGRTSVVIFALPNWPLGPVVAELLTGLVGELDRLGYTPLVHFVHAGGPDGLQKACDRVRPVGLIAPGTDLPPLDLLRANGCRGIVTLGQPPEPGVPSFSLDQRSVGAVAIEHLAERGHTNVLAVTPLGSQLQPLGEQRLAGARAAAERLGVTLTDVPANGLARGLARRPTAVYAFNDEIALGARDSLPPGVALIGTDDSPPARLAHPRLTTIKLGTPEGHREMVRTLHALIEGREVDATPVVIKPRVIQGETT
ncbi:LacI family DNA-binding transcriptional regulator [Solirubrobacter sp. CPCC 204708]|uniref:LacI family transcriptional regulator n=1 Tax=Solirubrobacter deserti TaxID=2282478 RepID=A0ABT4RLE2_9ACTN|nr:LacI family DNA-binding transcriptional regulator [Solirubrobacter deserti]MBE2319082.1 LacI family DNA-binding transcriptional regulator [Solirubrobacter deserti]MDA0139161.1 LacI family transcriptional regulator [Solirubrobacter deserti]